MKLTTEKLDAKQASRGYRRVILPEPKRVIKPTGKISLTLRMQKPTARKRGA